MRKILGLALVLSLSLVMAYGAIGSSASFSVSGSVSEAIDVGSFGCTITSTTPGAVVTNTGSTHTVSYTAPTIMASAAGSAPLAFTVNDTGNIPVKVTVSQTVPVAPFTSILTDPVADVLMDGSGQSHAYAAGLQWPELGMADLQKRATITYTINCLESGAQPLPTGPAVTLTGSTIKTASYTAGPAPAVDAVHQTITWTVPVDTADTPMAYVGGNPILGQAMEMLQGRYTATSTGTIRVRVNATVSSSLTAQANKFNLVYRSNVFGQVYPVIGALNVANYDPSALSRHLSDNGFAVSWAGLTGGVTGSVTITLVFVAQ